MTRRSFLAKACSAIAGASVLCRMLREDQLGTNLKFRYAGLASMEIDPNPMRFVYFNGEMIPFDPYDGRIAYMGLRLLTG